MFLTASATTQKRIEPILDNKKKGLLLQQKRDS